MSSFWVKIIHNDSNFLDGNFFIIGGKCKKILKKYDHGIKNGGVSQKYYIIYKKTC